MKNKFAGNSGFLTWFMALLLAALAAGCGGGGSDGRNPILGGDGIAVIAPLVTFVAPLPNATGVPINTRIVTAAFNKAMDPATLNAASFTLACPAGTAQAGAVSYLASGNVATLTLTSNLPASALCTATITTAAKDAGGNPLATAFRWTFTTGLAADITPPTVSGTVNANGATNVAINTRVGATFSEVMAPATISNANFLVRQTLSGAAVAGTVSYVGVSAVFIPASNFANSTGYTITVKGGAGGATDLAGNPLASDYVWSWTTGAAADTTPPTVTGTIHANGATNVAVNTRVGATFSEAMDPLTINTGNFTLTQTASGAAVVGIVSYSGVSATFIPLSNLAFSTNYTVTVKGGVSGAKDLAGNPLASDFVISWTTGVAPDTTPPTVTATINANGATNVPVNTKAGATFSEPMDPLTITNGNFTLRETVSGTAVVDTVSYSGVSAVFIPAGNLLPNISYTATIKGGVNGAKDLAGNPLASDYVWSWTTGTAPDTTAPIVIGTVNANGATNVPINTRVGATFSEAMNPLNITNVNFTLKQTAGGTAVAGTMSYSGVNALFIPTSNLANSTNYTATVKGGVSGVTDLAGNPMTADYVWAWTTGAAADLIAPTIVLTDPLANAIDVPINSLVAANFSEAMDPLTITSNSFRLECPVGTPINGTVQYYSVNRSVAIFTPAALLPNGTACTATVSNAVKDLAGNALASGLVANPWIFNTVAAAVIPPIVPITPPSAALAIDLGVAASYGVASRAGLTSTGVTVVNGNVALLPLASCTDATGNAGASQTCLVKTYSSPTGMTVNGSIYWAGDPFDSGATALAVSNALNVAWVEGKSKVDTQATGALGGELGGKLIVPGVYHEAALGLMAGGIATLDAQNDANAIFIFKIDSSFVDSGTLLLPSQIRLTRGAQARNVWFVAGLDITIGSGTTWKGNILAGRSATIKNGSAVLGRVLAGASGAGAFTITGAASPSLTSITVP